MKTAIFGAVALAVFGAQAAQAQTQTQVNHGAPVTGVCVYHNERLLAESSAGQSLNTGMQRLLQEVQTELQPYGANIQSEAQRIQQAGEAGDPDGSQRQALQQRVQEAQQLEQTREVELRYTRAQQLNAIATAVDPIIVQIYQERGCSILLDRESVYVFNPAMDITQTAIERLNAALPSLSFSRQSPPQQQAPAGQPGTVPNP